MQKIFDASFEFYVEKYHSRKIAQGIKEMFTSCLGKIQFATIIAAIVFMVCSAVAAFQERTAAVFCCIAAEIVAVMVLSTTEKIRKRGASAKIRAASTKAEIKKGKAGGMVESGGTEDITANIANATDDVEKISTFLEMNGLRNIPTIELFIDKCDEIADEKTWFERAREHIKTAWAWMCRVFAIVGGYYFLTEVMGDDAATSVELDSIVVRLLEVFEMEGAGVLLLLFCALVFSISSIDFLITWMLDDLGNSRRFRAKAFKQHLELILLQLQGYCIE